MVRWQTLTSLVVVLACSGPAWAQAYDLAETPLEGTYFKVRLTMELVGEILVQKGDKVVPIKQDARASHEYFERVLEAPESGPATKTARIYKEARAIITVGSDRSERGLRPEHCLLSAQRTKDQLVTFSPKGPLTREELELTQHFDSLALTGLLPGQEVRMEQTWKVPNAVVQALCHFDGLTDHDLEARLDQVKDDIALVLVKGTANGIDAGAAVKSTIRATCEFDLKTQHLIALDWKQTDERDQGPASPAQNLSMSVTAKRMAVQPVDELHDFRLNEIPRGPVPEAMIALTYADPKGRYDLVYAREWQLVAHTDDFVVMRLLDRGDFVAQVTVTPLPCATPGKHISDDEFKELVNATPGWQAETETRVEESPASGGNTIRRLAVEGQLDGLKAAQYCYLVASPQGEQVVVAFTMTPAQVQTLDTRDLALVRGITFAISRKQGGE
jgi:hypothetical protein